MGARDQVQPLTKPFHQNLEGQLMLQQAIPEFDANRGKPLQGDGVWNRRKGPTQLLPGGAILSGAAGSLGIEEKGRFIRENGKNGLQGKTSLSCSKAAHCQSLQDLDEPGKQAQIRSTEKEQFEVKGFIDGQLLFGRRTPSYPSVNQGRGGVKAIGRGQSRIAEAVLLSLIRPCLEESAVETIHGSATPVAISLQPVFNPWANQFLDRLAKGASNGRTSIRRQSSGLFGHQLHHILMPVDCIQGRNPFIHHGE